MLLAVAYLVALQLAVVRARRSGLDGARVMDLGIYLIIAALVGAKLMLVVVDFNYFREHPRELLSLVRAAGVFYGGLIVAVPVGLWLVRRYGLPMWTTADLFAPGIALGHVIGRFGCLLAGCCYGRRRPTAVGDHVHQSGRRGQRRHAARRSAASDAALRRRGRAPDPRVPAGLRTPRAPVPGRTFWLYMLLYAISRFVVEIYPRRSARRDSGALDVAVRVGADRAAGDRHAAAAARRIRDVGAGAARP